MKHYVTENRFPRQLSIFTTHFLDMPSMSGKSVFSAHPSTENVPDPGIEPANSYKMALVLKFRIQEEEALYYLCSENKCAVSVPLISHV